MAALRSGFGPDCAEANLLSKSFSSMSDVIAWKPTAAIIASPAPYHLEQAIYLARHDIPLLIEKPVGSGQEKSISWNSLISMSKKLHIEVAYVLRHHPAIQYVKNELNKFPMSTLLEADFYCGSWLPSWRKDHDYANSVSARRELGGGVLLELSHEIDLAHFLLGDFNLSSSLLSNTGILTTDVEDQAILVGTSGGKCLVSIRLNFCTTPTRRYFTLRGPEFHVECNLEQSTVQSYSKITDERKSCSFSLGLDTIYYLQMKNFFDSLVQNKPPFCSLEEGLRTLKVISKAKDLSPNCH